MTKICTSCHTIKDRFPAQKAGKDGFSSWCRDCYTVFQKQWRKANKAQHKLTQRKSYLKMMFNITPEDYTRMFTEQNGRCAICKTHQTDLKRILGVDHNHTTGKVRALLCGPCNGAIGLLKENPVLFQTCIEYLDVHRSK